MSGACIDQIELETDRLLLRKITFEDTDDIFEYASDPQVSLHTTWEPHRSLGDTLAFIQYVVSVYDEGRLSDWAIMDKGGCKVIGTCGFVSFHEQHARAEIGYALSRKYWGQGLMTETVQRVIQHGFEDLGLNRIEARCKIDNIGSSRVMEKSGMQLEGIFREQMKMKGRYCDIMLYAILNHNKN